MDNRQTVKKGGKTVIAHMKQLFVWLVGLLTPFSSTRLQFGRAPRQSVRQFYVLPHMHKKQIILCQTYSTKTFSMKNKDTT